MHSEEASSENRGLSMEQKTDWVGLSITSLLIFLWGAQLTVCFSTAWPFVLELYPSTSETFFGIMNACNSLTMGLMALLFGYLINKLEKSRAVTVIGFTSMFVGNLLYLLSSMKLFDKPWLFLVAWMFEGVGGGLYSVFQSYCVQSSSLLDRSRAFSIILTSFFLGSIAGYLVQAAFSQLTHPGISLIWSLNLNGFTAPAFFGLSCNLVAICVTVFFFQEAKTLSEKEEKKAIDDSVVLPPYDKLAVGICIFTQFVYMIMNATVETVLPPYVMTMFNWTKAEVQVYGAILMAATGCISLAIYCLDILFNLWNRLNQRIGATLGVLFTLIFFIVTFSWWFLAGTLTYHEEYLVVNGSPLLNPEPVGCRKTFTWCLEVSPVNVWLFNISYVIFYGTGCALINANMNSVFSKIIGPRKQGSLIGLLVCVGCLARTIAPVIMATLFENFGPRPVWSIVMLFSGCCASLWAAFYHHLQPLKIGA